MSLFTIYKHQNNSLWIRTNTGNSSFLDVCINLQVWYLELLTIYPGLLHFSIRMEVRNSIDIISIRFLEFSEYFPYK